ncbi:GntR family transcriptional regulator [bacterium LRH843]|nr:GntR family transcriptional regulator [bacterium LRH843]
MKNKISNLRIEDRDTLHLRVSHILREAILRGDFEQGERLVQSELAAALGVSRMPIREALRKLESEGLVTLEPHRGAIVRSIKIKDVVEIYGLRSQMEKMAVELSIDLFTDEDIQKLEASIFKMEHARDVDEFIQENIEFHRLLISRCPWERLLSFIQTLWNGFPQYTPHFIAGQIETSNEEHRTILTAIKEKDTKKVSLLVEDHIKKTGEKLVNSLLEE